MTTIENFDSTNPKFSPQIEYWTSSTHKFVDFSNSKKEEPKPEPYLNPPHGPN
jgi:hypothetical protein